MSLGRGRISNPKGAWIGKLEDSRTERLEEFKWKSLERESEMLFSSPENHWLYRQLLVSIIKDASFLAIDNWTNSSVSSAKLDFLSQPAADVLSDWLGMQSSA
jgi:hypothetical protein